LWEPQVSDGHTSIVIAHHISTILKADQILMVNEGRNGERGTHAGLVERSAADPESNAQPESARGTYRRSDTRD